MYAEKEVQGTKILHGESAVKTLDDGLKEHSRGGCKHNVINVEEQISHVGATTHDE